MDDAPARNPEHQQDDAELRRGVLGPFDEERDRLKSQGVGRETVKAFVLEQAARLKTHALDWCARTGRPCQYLGNLVRKEEMAWNGRSPQIRDAKRKCLHLYYYLCLRAQGCWVPLARAQL